MMLENGAVIVLDWGTTNVRAALLDKNGKVLDEQRGESGVGVFDRPQFAERFDQLTKNWPSVPAIAAGMVGSRQGWKEATYLPCPASLLDLSRALLNLNHKGRKVTIVPGLKLETSNRFDVMRGEESQLAGFIAANPNFTGTVIMPGTHSKWVQIEQNSIVDFQTYMTGELFEAISENTILRHSVSAPESPSEEFGKHVERLAGEDVSTEGSLFSLRARHLLKNSDASELRQELSALLIMAELKAGQSDGFVLSENVTLIGTEGLTAYYELALNALGHKSDRIRGTTLVWPALFDLAQKAGLLKETMA